MWLLCTSEALFALGPKESGLLLGFNGSIFTGSEATLNTNRYIPGITLGFYHEFKIKSRFVIEPEVLFITKGSRMNTVGDLYLHHVFTYLEVPVLAKWIINPPDKAKVFLSGGPYIALKLIAFNEVGFPEEINSLDAGVNLGAGVKFQRLSFRIHLIQGFLDTDRSISSDIYKNRTFSLIVGLSL